MGEDSLEVIFDGRIFSYSMVDLLEVMFDGDDFPEASNLIVL